MNLVLGVAQSVNTFGNFGENLAYISLGTSGHTAGSQPPFEMNISATEIRKLEPGNICRMGLEPASVTRLGDLLPLGQLLSVINALLFDKNSTLGNVCNKVT